MWQPLEWYLIHGWPGYAFKSLYVYKLTIYCFLWVICLVIEMKWVDAAHRHIPI